jgi:indolepyruvate ferredoxin oxidoreductase alpha subunit
MKKIELLSGNEAIARGAYEAGVSFVAGYPGTPSTEILEEAAHYEDINAQWSTNEKVAIDVALGVALGGRRAMVAMKHVGLNVAADTLMTLSYTGINAGLVVITVDDPGMYSSQNEQDNRVYAKFAQIPLLEPTDSQECKDYIHLAFKISERFDTVVLLRITARVAHSKSIVGLGHRLKKTIINQSFIRNPAKFVMIPSNARRRRIWVEKRSKKLKEFAERVWCNKIEWAKKDFGIIASGICYQYAKEIYPDASYLKLGMSYPLPELLIRRFAQEVSTLYTIEELTPFLEEQIQTMGVPTKGKELFPIVGGLNPDLIKQGLDRKFTKRPRSKVVPRFPSLCPGCSYLGLFYVLKRLDLIVIGDIGCYSLAATLPRPAMDTCISMGASIGVVQGLETVLDDRMKQRVVAVIGDSTFIHSGITPLLNLAYNQGTTTIIILDNQTTAMTGGQSHPGTGITLKGKKTSKLNYEHLIRAVGINRVTVIDSYNLKEIEKVISRELIYSQPSVIIARNICALTAKKKRNTLFRINDHRCINCKECLKLGCLAIVAEEEKPSINLAMCNGCSLCQQVCKIDAIEEIGIELEVS